MQAQAQPQTEKISYEHGIEPHFNVNKINGIEVFGYNDALLQYGNFDPCPFVTKVETYLCLLGVPYKKVDTKDRKAPRKELPYMNFYGTCVADSGDIVNYLRVHQKDINSGIAFTGFQNTMMTMMTCILEQSFYFCCLHEYYLNKEQWNHTKKTLNENNHSITGFLSSISTPFKKAAVSSALDSQGYGKMPAEKVIEKGLLDLQCIEDCLGLFGEGPFFMGQHLTVIDVTIFAFSAPFFKLQPGWKLSRLFSSITPQRYPKISALCEIIYSKVVTMAPPQVQTNIQSSIFTEQHHDQNKLQETVTTTVNDPKYRETTYVMRERIENNPTIIDKL